MPPKEIYEPYLDEDEKIVFRCGVNRKFVILFRVLSAVCAALALGWVPFMIRGIKNAPAAYLAQLELQKTNPSLRVLTPPLVTLIVIGILAAFFVAAAFCFFFSRSLSRRVYLLTDRRLFCSKGGVILSSRRILDLSSVNGVERNQNLFTLIFSSCTINFYSPSAAMTSSKFLFLFSRSTFRFSLFGVPADDAEKFISLYLKTKREAGNNVCARDARP